MQDQVPSSSAPRARPGRPSEFASEWRRFDRMLGGYQRALLTAAELAPGRFAIDVGCGAGTTSLAAARAVGSEGRVLGVDVDADVLEVARRRARDDGLDQVSFVQADATTHPFAAAATDAVISRFGTLHFRDRVAGFSHLRAALAPGGRLAFVCGREQARNLWASIPRRVLFGLLGKIPDGARATGGPFVLADPLLVRSMLRDAGFSAVELQSLDDDVCIGADLDDALEFFFEADGDKLAPVLEAIGYGRAADALRHALEPYASWRGVWVPASAWLVTARA